MTEKTTNKTKQKRKGTNPSSSGPFWIIPTVIPEQRPFPICTGSMTVVWRSLPRLLWKIKRAGKTKK